MTEPARAPNGKGGKDLLHHGEGSFAGRPGPGARPSGRAARGRLQVRGSYFPAAGNRNNSSGSVNNVGGNGNYWSSSPNSTDNGRNLNFNSTNLNPLNNNNRSNGFSVRPARIRHQTHKIINHSVGCIASPCPVADAGSVH